MNPVTFLLLTFGVWVVAKGRAPAYWALATTPAPKGAASPGSSNPSAGTGGTASGNSVGQAIGSAAGSALSSSLPPLPSLPSLISSNPQGVS